MRTCESFVLLGFDLIRESLGLGVTSHSDFGGCGALDVLVQGAVAGVGALRGAVRRSLNRTDVLDQVKF